ncbi:uncharacterized protein AMSG_10449 [Thecamonas trahens ATCC 50062]|uniref:Uncharacterized protein n=1 Tax=Thecamonas trahens ATCC 50062 TaxID=461836 RepID=A0A0L0DQ70_THETB|nr:hypothetical protein AMSG_10449 [Thecamonas trahens ATCC 50062]KNC54454.1 hypothetical protein AMSG_10449 [Thecamonas trahens ATCC 50062]|eukprot:XP_013753610.1 hypothetical protein AMSG_10449 [Thecamonas trahens ATCC 50062]
MSLLLHARLSVGNVHLRLETDKTVMGLELEELALKAAVLSQLSPLTKLVVLRALTLYLEPEPKTRIANAKLKDAVAFFAAAADDDAAEISSQPIVYNIDASICVTVPGPAGAHRPTVSVSVPAVPITISSAQVAALGSLSNLFSRRAALIRWRAFRPSSPPSQQPLEWFRYAAMAVLSDIRAARTQMLGEQPPLAATAAALAVAGELDELRKLSATAGAIYEARTRAYCRGDGPPPDFVLATDSTADGYSPALASLVATPYGRRYLSKSGMPTPSLAARITSLARIVAAAAPPPPPPPPPSPPSALSRMVQTVVVGLLYLVLGKPTSPSPPSPPLPPASELATVTVSCLTLRIRSQLHMSDLVLLTLSSLSVGYAPTKTAVRLGSLHLRDLYDPTGSYVNILTESHMPKHMTHAQLLAEAFDLRTPDDVADATPSAPRRRDTNLSEPALVPGAHPLTPEEQATATAGMAHASSLGVVASYAVERAPAAAALAAAARSSTVAPVLALTIVSRPAVDDARAGTSISGALRPLSFVYNKVLLDKVSAVLKATAGPDETLPSSLLPPGFARELPLTPQLAVDALNEMTDLDVDVTLDGISVILPHVATVKHGLRMVFDIESLNIAIHRGLPHLEPPASLAELPDSVVYSPTDIRIASLSVYLIDYASKDAETATSAFRIIDPFELSVTSASLLLPQLTMRYGSRLDVALPHVVGHLPGTKYRELMFCLSAIAFEEEYVAPYAASREEMEPILAADARAGFANKGYMAVRALSLKLELHADDNSSRAIDLYSTDFSVVAAPPPGALATHYDIDLPATTFTFRDSEQRYVPAEAFALHINLDMINHFQCHYEPYMRMGVVLPSLELVLPQAYYAMVTTILAQFGGETRTGRVEPRVDWSPVDDDEWTTTVISVVSDNFALRLLPGYGFDGKTGADAGNVGLALSSFNLAMAVTNEYNTAYKITARRLDLVNHGVNRRASPDLSQFSSILSPAAAVIDDPSRWHLDIDYLVDVSWDAHATVTLDATDMHITPAAVAALTFVGAWASAPDVPYGESPPPPPPAIPPPTTNDAIRKSPSFTVAAILSDLNIYLVRHETDAASPALGLLLANTHLSYTVDRAWATAVAVTLSGLEAFVTRMSGPTQHAVAIFLPTDLLVKYSASPTHLPITDSRVAVSLDRPALRLAYPDIVLVQGIVAGLSGPQQPAPSSADEALATAAPAAVAALKAGDKERDLTLVQASRAAPVPTVTVTDPETFSASSSFSSASSSSSSSTSDLENFARSALVEPGASLADAGDDGAAASGPSAAQSDSLPIGSPRGPPDSVRTSETEAEVDEGDAKYAKLKESETRHISYYLVDLIDLRATLFDVAKRGAVPLLELRLDSASVRYSDVFATRASAKVAVHLSLGNYNHKLAAWEPLLEPAYASIGYEFNAFENKCAGFAAYDVSTETPADRREREAREARERRVRERAARHAEAIRRRKDRARRHKAAKKANAQARARRSKRKSRVETVVPSGQRRMVQPPLFGQPMAIHDTHPFAGEVVPRHEPDGDDPATPSHPASTRPHHRRHRHRRRMHKAASGETFKSPSRSSLASAGGSAVSLAPERGSRRKVRRRRKRRRTVDGPVGSVTPATPPARPAVASSGWSSSCSEQHAHATPRIVELLSSSASYSLSEQYEGHAAPGAVVEEDELSVYTCSTSSMGSVSVSSDSLRLESESADDEAEGVLLSEGLVLGSIVLDNDVAQEESVMREQLSTSRKPTSVLNLNVTLELLANVERLQGVMAALSEPEKQVASDPDWAPFRILNATDVAVTCWPTSAGETVVEGEPMVLEAGKLASLEFPQTRDPRYLKRSVDETHTLVVALGSPSAPKLSPISLDSAGTWILDAVLEHDGREHEVALRGQLKSMGDGSHLLVLSSRFLVVNETELPIQFRGLNNGAVAFASEAVQPNGWTALPLWLVPTPAWAFETRPVGQALAIDGIGFQWSAGVGVAFGAASASATSGVLPLRRGQSKSKRKMAKAKAKAKAETGDRNATEMANEDTATLAGLAREGRGQRLRGTDSLLLSFAAGRKSGDRRLQVDHASDRNALLYAFPDDATLNEVDVRDATHGVVPSEAGDDWKRTVRDDPRDRLEALSRIGHAYAVLAKDIEAVRDHNGSVAIHPLPAVRVRLLSPVYVTNLLPYSAHVTVWCDGEEVLASNVIPGGRVPVYGARPDGEMDLAVAVPGYGSSERSEASLATEMGELGAVLELPGEAGQGTGPLNLYAFGSTSGSGVGSLEIYSRFWMVNRTGLPLKYAPHATMGTHAGEGHGSAVAAPYLFSYAEKRKLSRSKATIKVHTSEWSNGVSLANIADSGAIKVLDRTALAELDLVREWQLGIKIHKASGAFGRTSVVVIEPRYVLVNRLDEPLLWRQVGTEVSHRLEGGEHHQVHFVTAGGADKLQLGFFDADCVPAELLAPRPTAEERLVAVQAAESPFPDESKFGLLGRERSVTFDMGRQLPCSDDSSEWFDSDDGDEQQEALSECGTALTGRSRIGEAPPAVGLPLVQGEGEARARAEEQYANWSSAFAVDGFGVVDLNVYASHSEVLSVADRVRLQISVDDPVVYVVVSRPQAAQTAPRYKLVNDTVHPIYYWQCDVEQAVVAKLEPWTSTAYGWDAPHADKKKLFVQFQAAGDKPIGLKVEIDETKAVPETVSFFSEELGEVVQLEVRVYIEKGSHTHVLRVYDPKHASKSRSDDDGVTMMEAQKSSAIISRIKVHVPGLGISVIDPTPEELLYAWMVGAEVLLETDERAIQTGHITVERLQVDNQDEDSVFPVVVNMDEGPLRKGIPFLQIVYNKAIASERVQLFGPTVVAIQALTVRVEEGLVVRLMSMAEGLPSAKASLAASLEDSLAVSSQEPSYDEAAGWVREVYFRVLAISPISLKVSFESALDKSDSILSKVLNLGLLLPSFDSAPIVFKHMLLEHLFTTQASLQALVAKHYERGLMRQVLKIVGSLDMLGNPVKLWSNITHGFHESFHASAESVLLGPREFSRGVGKSAVSLTKHVAYAMFDATSAITSSMGKAVAKLSFDDEYLRKQEALRRRRANNAGRGLILGASAFGKGLFWGVSGLVLQPAKGAKRGGVKGFVKGMGRGVVGLGVKPVVGVLNLLTKTLEGVRNSVDIEVHFTRLRPPRHFWLDGRVHAYSWHLAHAQLLLYTLRSGAFAASDAVLAEALVADGSLMVIVTNNRILLLRAEGADAGESGSLTEEADATVGAVEKLNRKIVRQVPFKRVRRVALGSWGVVVAEAGASSEPLVLWSHSARNLRFVFDAVRVGCKVWQDQHGHEHQGQLH